MRFLCRAVCGIFASLTLGAAAQQPGADPQVLHVDSRLVVLDATVTDKAGKLVTQPLTQTDFQVREDGQPQTLYSFESANDHADAETKPGGESRLVVFVLDEYNYAYVGGRTDVWNLMNQAAQYTHAREDLAAFLASQPSRLHERMEVLALTHHGYLQISKPTRDRDALLEIVRQHNPGLGSPFRDHLEESSDATLSNASFQAIWSLVLQLRGLPGRKLVLWLGNGGPNNSTSQAVSGDELTDTERQAREIINLLVDARVTLDICGPGVSTADDQVSPASINAGLLTTQSASYGYERDFGFAGFVSATGGRWRNGNDIRGQIQTAATYDATYYTLSYRPRDHDSNSQFRKVEVTVPAHPEWTVRTKAGYYALPPDADGGAAHRQQLNLRVALFEAAPFTGITANLERVERLKDSESARFTFQISSDDLQWSLDPDLGRRRADVLVTGAALGSIFQETPEAVRATTWKLLFPEEHADRVRSEVSVILPVDTTAKRLRFIFEDLSTGRMGSADVSPDALANAVAVDPPDSGLRRRLPASPSQP